MYETDDVNLKNAHQNLPHTYKPQRIHIPKPITETPTNSVPISHTYGQGKLTF